MKKTALPLLLSLLASLTLITACQSKPKLACNSPEVQEATIASILETAEADALTHNQAGLTIDSASIKSIFSQIKLSIDDTRTDKTDDNKISCAASLKIELPAAMLNDANALATTAKTSTLTEIAQKMGMMATGSTLKKDISFTAQQTDDGKKIKVDLFDLKSIATVPSTLAYYTLAKPAVDTKLASDAKAANDAQKAAFDKAKSANTAANKAINELWKNLPADLQAQNADAIEDSSHRRRTPIHQAYLRRGRSHDTHPVQSLHPNWWDASYKRRANQARRSHDRSAVSSDLLCVPRSRPCSSQLFADFRSAN